MKYYKCHRFDCVFGFQEEAESRRKESECRLDAAAQTEDHNTSTEEEPHSSGELVLPKRAPLRRDRQQDKVPVRKPRKYRGKKQEAFELPIIDAVDLPQLADSDAENALSEQLARDLTHIQVKNGITESHLVKAEEESEFISEEHSKTRKRKGRRMAIKNRSTVADGVPNSSGAVRRLAPFSETIQFLNIDGGAEPTPVRRKLRPRK